MEGPDRDAVERVGPHYSRDKMLLARRKTREAIHKIAARVIPGMSEEDAVIMARGILREEKLLRGWHPPFVRFGRNTVKTYGASSDPGVVLARSDIFFIDIGPVWKQWEGDGGETFVVGSDPLLTQCACDARRLFDQVHSHWTQQHVSGQALYDFALTAAENMGWRLNLDLSGHRLADFPHSTLHNGSLAEFALDPAPQRWVLEIHIRHPSFPFGAFFEDMLLTEEDLHYVGADW